LLSCFISDTAVIRGIAEKKRTEDRSKDPYYAPLQDASAAAPGNAAVIRP